MGSTSAVAAFVLRRQLLTSKIIESKLKKNLTWEQLGKTLNRSPIWTVSACLGQNSMDEPSAKKLISTLEILDPPDSVNILCTPPIKSHYDFSILSQDPVIARFQEINYVYGLALKELIHEKFGDGIMSAVDFTMEVEKIPDPNGDRVEIKMNGKFLPYKKW